MVRGENDFFLSVKVIDETPNPPAVLTSYKLQISKCFPSRVHFDNVHIEHLT